jgi:hypothetical protein
MASLDEMEGDAVELAALLLLVLIIVAVFLAWRGFSAPLNWLEQLWQKFSAWLKNLFDFAQLTGAGGPAGPANGPQVATGGSDGNWSTPPAGEPYFLPDGTFEPNGSMQ